MSLRPSRRKSFFGWRYRWGIVDRWQSPSSWPAQNQVLDADGRYTFRLRITPRQLLIIQSALFNGLEIFPIEDYSSALDAFIRDTNATEEPQVNIPVGGMMPYAGNFTVSPVEGFMLCEGQLLSRTEYPELFAVIGTLYDTEQASNMFRLPDMRGRFPMGARDIPNQQLGQSAGRDEVQVRSENMPLHNHTVNLVQSAGTGNPGIAFARGNNVIGAVNTSFVGAGTPLGVRNPYVAISFIIRVR